MVCASALNDGRTSSAPKSSLSETESLAELVVRETTESALQRTSSNMSNSQTSMEPTAAARMEGHGGIPAAKVSGLVNGSLTTPVEQPIARSALRHLGSSASSPFKTDAGNGTTNRAAVQVKPVAAPSETEEPTTQAPDGLSQTESMAEPIVRPATTTTLERSGCNKGRFFSANPVSCTLRDVSVKDEASGVRAKPMDNEKTVPIPSRGVQPLNEPFAELVVLSATASALQRSTSSLLKVGTKNGATIVNRDSMRTPDRKDKEQRVGKAERSAKEYFGDDLAMQTKVARTVEEKVETARSTTANIRINASAPWEAKERGNTSQSENVVSNHDAKLSRDAAGRTIVGEKARGGGGVQVGEIGDGKGMAIGGLVGSVGTRGGGNDDAGTKNTLGIRNVPQHGSEETGSKEDYIQDYSSDAFEEEEDAETPSDTSSLSSGTSDSRGRQRRRPPQTGRSLISAIISAASSDRHTIVRVASTKPYDPTPPNYLRLEDSENNHTRNIRLADARTEEKAGIAPRLSVCHSGRSASPRRAGADHNGSVSVNTSSASPGGSATSSRESIPFVDVSSQGSTDGTSGSRTPPMPSGPVIGLEALNRDLSAWFCSDVLAPSTAAATSFLGGTGREKLPNVSSPTSQIIAIPSENDGIDDSGINVAAPEVHTQREPATLTMAREVFSNSRVPEKHPARLFHLLWQRGRQAGGV